MDWNITNPSLNIIFYLTLIHFLFLLLGYCYFERKEIKNSSYRYFVYSIAAIIMDGFFILLFISGQNAFKIWILNAITFFIIFFHSLCTAFLLEWFFENMRERGLSFRRQSKITCNIVLVISLLLNVVLSFQKNYSNLVFGKNYIAPPNAFSFFYSFTIIGIVIYYSMRYRKKLSMAPILCMMFSLLTPQILLLSNMRLHAACALYATLCFFLIHHYYWVLERKKLAYNESEARTKKMIIMHQIRPHFIFNCLSSIEVLCERNAKKAQVAISDLAGLLRSSMDELGNEHKKSFSEILKMTEAYIRLEQMRFGEKIKVEFDCEETDFSLPPFIIQPLVENAIKHGLANKKNGGTIKISSCKNGADVVICIEDNGLGMDDADENKSTDSDQRTHIGISNVRERLNMLCNGKMIIQSEKNCGTKITLRIPFEENR